MILPPKIQMRPDEMERKGIEMYVCRRRQPPLATIITITFLKHICHCEATASRTNPPPAFLRSPSMWKSHASPCSFTPTEPPIR